MLRLSRYLDLPTPRFEGVMAWILQLRSERGSAHALAEIGIDDTRAETIGTLSARDVTARTSTVKLDAAQYQQLFRNALSGTL